MLKTTLRRTQSNLQLTLISNRSVNCSQEVPQPERSDHSMFGRQQRAHAVLTLGLCLISFHCQLQAVEAHELSSERIVFQTKHGNLEMALYPKVRPAQYVRSIAPRDTGQRFTSLTVQVAPVTSAHILKLAKVRFSSSPAANHSSLRNCAAALQCGLTPGCRACRWAPTTRFPSSGWTRCVLTAVLGDGAVRLPNRLNCRFSTPPHADFRR